MQKIVTNKCYGGFGLSGVAEVEYAKRSGFEIFRYQQTKYEHRDGSTLYEKIPADSDEAFMSHTFKTDLGDSFSEWPEKDDDIYWYSNDLERTDPILVAVVEEMGEKANGSYANLRVTEIPDDVEWDIQEYDGQEWVAERHRTW